METKKRTQATDIAEIATKLIGKVKFSSIIYSQKMLSEKYRETDDADSYIGKQTLIFPNGESMTQDWACVRGAFERKKRRGELKVLR